MALFSFPPPTSPLLNELRRDHCATLFLVSFVHETCFGKNSTEMLGLAFPSCMKPVLIRILSKCKAVCFLHV